VGPPIRASAIPVISPSAHEIDLPIADFVADLRAADAIGGRRDLSPFA